MKNKPKPERRLKKRVKAVPEETQPPQAVIYRGTDTPFPIVGIGASAGGLSAFEAFFSDMPADTAIRIWVPGCSTGEEAYSLAILLAERQAALDLLGMTRDQLLAANAVSLSPEHQPDGRLSREKAGELIAQCLSKGSLRFDWVHCRAGGEPFPVEITMTAYREQGKTFLHSVWRDRRCPACPTSPTKTPKQGETP